MGQALYYRRSLVEMVISALKGKYGAAVSSQVWWREFRELVGICLVCNCGAGGEAGGVLP
jgi:hypothetical protein